MKKVLLLLSFGGIALFIGFITFLLRTDVQMTFPSIPHGTLIQQPIIVSTGTTQFVQWTVPEKCLMNSYEVQEVGYTPDSGKVWGGKERDAVSCVFVSGGYQCQAEVFPEMKDGLRQWKIQTSSRDCDGGDDFVSEVTDYGIHQRIFPTSS